MMSRGDGNSSILLNFSLISDANLGSDIRYGALQDFASPTF